MPAGKNPLLSSSLWLEMRLYTPRIGAKQMPPSHETSRQLLPFRWQKYYNILVIVASRGVGSLIVMTLFLIKKYTLSAQAFGDLGYAYASAATLLSPFASPIMMIISRRVIQTRDLGRDKKAMLFWAFAALALGLFSVLEQLASSGTASPLGVFSSVCGLLLIIGLNGQYVIWLNESDRTALSLTFIVVLLSTIPLAGGIRLMLSISPSDPSFSIETILLSLPVLLNSMRIKRSSAELQENIYTFSKSNYVKYFMVVLFYSGTLWVDWTLGRSLLPAGEYAGWANDRIFMERLMLPVLNIMQVALLWHLLRSSIGQQSKSANTVSAEMIGRWNLFLAFMAVTATMCWLLSFWAQEFDLISFCIGYLTYGLTSIFLDFYQAKFSVRHIATSFLILTIVHALAVSVSTYFGGVAGFGLAWSLTSVLVLFYLSKRSWSEIKIG
jgi:hypothetical protein